MNVATKRRTTKIIRSNYQLQLSMILIKAIFWYSHTWYLLLLLFCFVWPFSYNIVDVDCFIFVTDACALGVVFIISSTYHHFANFFFVFFSFYFSPLSFACAKYSSSFQCVYCICLIWLHLHLTYSHLSFFFFVFVIYGCRIECSFCMRIHHHPYKWYRKRNGSLNMLKKWKKECCIVHRDRWMKN